MLYILHLVESTPHPVFNYHIYIVCRVLYRFLEDCSVRIKGSIRSLCNWLAP